MRTMRYGVHFIGAYIQVKLRYKALLAMRIAQDNELRPFLKDITVSYNTSHTHAHIAFITHQSSNLVQLLSRVEKRQRHLIKKHEVEMEEKRLEHLADQDINPEC